MIENAVDGLRAIIAPPRPSPLSYIEGSFIGLLAIMLAVAVVPDAILVWLLVPHRFWWIAFALDFADIWGAFWLLGLYGTMAQRPHSVDGDRIILRNGALRSIAFDRSVIVNATPLGRLKRRNLPRKRGDGSLVLALGGVPIVEVRLKAPVDGVSRMFVASDRPEAFAMMLGEQ